MSDAAQWLEWLFGQEPPGLIWIGGHGDGWKGRTFAGAGEAAEYAQWLDDGAAGGVYFRLTLMRPVAEGRGTAADSSHVVAFGADLDLAGPGHKDAKLPRPGSEDELRSILADAGAPEPTAWVHSGGGRYAFWKLDAPLELGSAELLTEAQGKSSALHARIIAEAAVRDLKIDNTRDLARVYRLPGTHNRKGDIPFVAKVLSSGGPSHAFTSFGATSPSPARTDTSPPARTTTYDHVRTGSTQLFGGGQEHDPDDRRFTETDARAFVEEARLRLARDAEPGNYNNAINVFAKEISHFQAFWGRDFAEALIFETLKVKTGWPGLDGDDLATIESAYRSALADWQAVREPGRGEQEQAAATSDAVDTMLARMLDRDALIALPEPRPLVAGILDMDSESWIIGESGGFKSFVALDIACHVAGGMRWRDKQVTQGEVIYIVAEGAKGVRKRVLAWEKTYGRQADNLLVLPEPVQVAPDGPRGGIGQEWLTLVEIVRRRQPALVVIDTQARVTVGLKENDNSEMGVFILAVTRMRQAAGSCVLVVHHTGRDKGDARGASAIDGAQDTELKVLRPGGGEGRRALVAELRLDKQKDDDDREVVKFGMQVVTVGISVHTGKPLTSLALIPYDIWRTQEVEHAPLPDWKRDLTQNQVEVLRVLEDHSDEFGLTVTDVLRFIGERRKEEGRTENMAKSSCQTALNALAYLGKQGESTGVVHSGSHYILKSKLDDA